MGVYIFGSHTALNRHGTHISFLTKEIPKGYKTKNGNIFANRFKRMQEIFLPCLHNNRYIICEILKKKIKYNLNKYRRYTYQARIQGGI